MDIPEDQIQAVIEVLEKNETHLSDGYGYYCGSFQRGEGGVKGKLKEIAIEIISQLDRMRK